MTGTKRAMVMFSKVPSALPVKTRLAPRLTPAQVQALAVAFIRDLTARLVECEGLLDATAMVFYAPQRAGPEMAALAPGIRLVPQVGSDLGARLRAAVLALRSDGFERVVIIGSDSPTLPIKRIAEAFEALDAGADLALAGAADGGYVLIAVNGAHVILFERIPWSTSAVYAATLERARRAGLLAVELEPWYDVDDDRSLERLLRELRGEGPIGDEAPHTRRALMSVSRLTVPPTTSS